ncbi:SSI family serine proteinase inhibitor [Actinomadura litoris]|uniref:SSI family serine proteinase inhibitor n=1 Tax=Actinomadura litoris TaxID=2678616 RepID=UPI001FA7EF65|nr:SSI family serine proteinase inhibitor [Actinomadura litoris]
MPRIAALSAALPATVAAAVTAAVMLAHAVPADASEAPRTSLRLTLTYPGHDASGTRSVTLRCDPAGGSHPRAAPACAELRRAGGRLVHDPDGRVCTAQYSPVVAEARGSWRGTPVGFRSKFGNDCVMHSRTGTVFAF